MRRGASILRSTPKSIADMIRRASIRDDAEAGPIVRIVVAAVEPLGILAEAGYGAPTPPAYKRGAQRQVRDPGTWIDLAARSRLPTGQIERTAIRAGITGYITTRVRSLDPFCLPVERFQVLHVRTSFEPEREGYLSKAVLPTPSFGLVSLQINRILWASVGDYAEARPIVRIVVAAVEPARILAEAGYGTPTPPADKRGAQW